MRTHFCGLINATHIGHPVVLAGWVDVVRHLGGVCFIDIRDHKGIVQVTVQPESTAVFACASTLNYEDVIQVEGTVRAREAINANLPTGTVEVIATKIHILNRAAPLPFHAHENPSEETRLRYRYLDLRRPTMQKMLRTRAQMVRSMRAFLENQGFEEIETPILTKATPEGARDFLVPARMHAHHWYALPQSPQLFKQILMVAGFDRYYQIARCFRDEDLRADRQLEFTQLDLEFAFTEEKEIQSCVEDMIRKVFANVAHIHLPSPFPRMTWSEAMQRYGSDKPDLRCDLELTDVAQWVQDSTLPHFVAAARSPQGRVAALRVPQSAATLSRKMIDGYTAYVSKRGAQGLAYLKMNSQGEVTSPLAKFFSPSQWQALLTHLQVTADDVVFFGAGTFDSVSQYMGALRLKLGHDLGRITAGWRPLWVTDFPMFAWDETQQRYLALHHPFTAPAVDSVEELQAHASTAVSRGYDMVLNGNEIGGGSIRIHNESMQRAVLALLGIDAAQAQAKFGFLLDALRYGAPPHGGIAFGLDRIAALLCGTESIRDVIAFPKTTSAQCLMTGAPSPVASAQLAEVHVKEHEPEQ